MGKAFGVDMAQTSQELLEKVTTCVFAESSRALHVIHELATEHWLLRDVCHPCLVTALVPEDCILIVVEKTSNVPMREVAKSCDLILEKKIVVFTLILQVEDLECMLGASYRVLCKLYL